MASRRPLRKVGFQAIAVLALAGLFVLSAPASAITWGEPDSVHTWAGSILIKWQGEWIQFCSGSLIAPRVFLTAGHCTDFLIGFPIPLSDIRVSFSQMLFARNARWLDVASVHNHPSLSFTPFDFDLGVILLKKEVRDVGFGRLPSAGFLDDLSAQGLLRDARFVNVGYGTDQNIEETNQRMSSESSFKKLLDHWLYMSQNVHTGDAGTCFGDSGGPTLYRDSAGVETIVSVTSWGDAVCKSTNNNYRVDLVSSLDFIEAMIGAAS